MLIGFGCEVVNVRPNAVEFIPRSVMRDNICANSEHKQVCTHTFEHTHACGYTDSKTG